MADGADVVPRPTPTIVPVSRPQHATHQRRFAGTAETPEADRQTADAMGQEHAWPTRPSQHRGSFAPGRPPDSHGDADARCGLAKISPARSFLLFEGARADLLTATQALVADCAGSE